MMRIQRQEHRSPIEESIRDNEEYFPRDRRDSEEERPHFRRRPRPDPDLIFDYKNVASIRQFISETEKLVPARVSRLSSKQQRELTRQVKRARQLALLPIAPSHSSRGSS